MMTRHDRRYLEGFAFAARFIRVHDQDYIQSRARYIVSGRDPAQPTARNASRYDRGFVAGLRTAFGSAR